MKNLSEQIKKSTQAAQDNLNAGKTLLSKMSTDLLDSIRLLEDIFEGRQIELNSEYIDNNEGGGGFSIRVPGFKANPECPDDGQIFIEYYEGKVRVHVWNGDQNPITTEIEKE